MPTQIPLVASTLVWIGFLNAETGWLNGILGCVRPAPARLDQQRPFWVYPSLGAHRPVGDRQLCMIISSPACSASRPSCTTRRRSTAPAPGRRSAASRIPLMSPVLFYNLLIS